MFLQGKSLAVTPISPQYLKDAALISGAKQELLEDYSVLIAQAGEAPQFFIEGVGSCINGFQSLISSPGVEAVDTLLNELLAASDRQFKE